MKNNHLKVKQGAINDVGQTLDNFGIEGKILYVSDPIVDKLYGDVVKRQLLDKWDLKEELVDNNTISYAMNLAERIIATDIKCIVGLGVEKCWMCVNMPPIFLKLHIYQFQQLQLMMVLFLLWRF